MAWVDMTVVCEVAVVDVGVSRNAGVGTVVITVVCVVGAVDVGIEVAEFVVAVVG